MTFSYMYENSTPFGQAPDGVLRHLDDCYYNGRGKVRQKIIIEFRMEMCYV